MVGRKQNNSYYIYINFLKFFEEARLFAKTNIYNSILKYTLSELVMTSLIEVAWHESAHILLRYLVNNTYF